MPADSSNSPRFLHVPHSRLRSRSPQPSLADPHNDDDDDDDDEDHAAISAYHSPRLNVPRASPSWPSRESAQQRYSLYHQEASLRRSSNSRRLEQPSDQHPQNPPDPNPGMFNQAHSFSAMGAFVDGNVGTVNISTSNRFMKELLKETIPGAAFDSSARYPPPRCHAGTRLAILARCLQFIANSNCNMEEKKVRWVVGAAGVGKSAIMQSVAESPELQVGCHASVFFSINGRNDGTKAIITICYQLAAKLEPYRQVIEYEIARDPSLLHSSMPVQFDKLIVEPFINQPHLNAVGRVLIIVDGLDECSNPRTQVALLRLIFDFCTNYPSSPIVWLIASRPETHITSFFSRTEVMSAYEKEEILVDSDEARADVERFLRAEFTEIKQASGSLDPQWPKEEDFWKVASAAGGLFAYAQTVMRYIGDSNIGSPASQLSDVLNVIDEHPMTDVPREEHPMALLDALYARILSKVPSKIVTYTRKLLLVLTSDWAETLNWLFDVKANLALQCNWLGITPDEAYAAINHLHSVLRVPRRDEAHVRTLSPFHKSFLDYISHSSRSGFSPDIHHDARRLMTECTSRILTEVPNGVDCGDVNYEFKYGTLRRGSDIGNKISLTWLASGEVGEYDDKTRLDMYKLAIAEVITGMKRRDPTFLNVSFIRLLATRFQEYSYDCFPRNEMRDLLFDDSRRTEFMTHSILKQMPLKIVDISTIFSEVKLRFCRPATTVTNLSDPWNPSCQHEREGEWREGKDMDWMARFSRRGCRFCYRRFEDQLISWKTQSPDHSVTILITSAEYCCVEVRFVDLEDGVSEWTYWFWFKLLLEKRKEYRVHV